MPFTQAQQDSAFRATKACVIAKARKFSPPFILNQVLDQIDAHEDDIRDIANAALAGTTAESEG
jgi:hypothetical protein